MKARAAVLWEAKSPWVVQDIELDAPKAGEVLVKLIATGLCHSDDHVRTGDLPIPLPIIGGHEGAGIVQEVGPEVHGVEVGDHVVLSFIPACGKCRWCTTGQSNLCDRGAFIAGGKQLDGTFRAHADGKDLGSMLLLGAFATHAVVAEDSVVKIDKGIPLELACLTGCGVMTGWGSAVKTGEVSPGDTVVVVGIGGIGGNAVQGAKMAGAKNIVAVDIADAKKEMAARLGATHYAGSVEEAKGLVNELTRGVMADVAILTVGVVHGDMVQQMLELIRKGGRAVITALAKLGELDTKLHLMELTSFQKEIRGSLFGAGNPRSDIPLLLGLYKSGQLKLDELVTKKYRLEEINEAYDDMMAGRLLRGVIIHEH
ncbi:NDMA-dependent alcohol dehydrogenase [Streptomyces sp. NBC_01231]|nr:NDMA-dependent alcohol dehydrogenase [Streptomyces sp. NBC_01231]